ncbi:RluA family pseudouridine synthase [Fundicoccus culcitae]|uniref:Pseudouridine synthase n=1 Tax=Fundicoccus culcitae TaxID=2969821 RepID=A0ABY5P7J2_9LACT|nr:RluA family pseudouridine synthase [Fundicoccus culcitae]UUX34514.1 RluA family pseudouridine synthase [Fundicoccus culcitae]
MTEKRQLKGEKGRLDTVLAQLINQSRSSIQKLIKEGSVLVNGVTEKANFQLNGDEEITYSIPTAAILDDETIELVGEDIPLDIVYEDDSVIVINKARGIVVHPSKGHTKGTLVNALIYYLSQAKLSSGTDNYRPGIVHRIDKDTSGLLVVAKNNETHQKLSDQLADHTMARIYVALVHGVVQADEGTIEVPLKRDPNDRLRWSAHKEGKVAVTHFKVLQRFEQATLVELNLETGRTHQIRVHMEYIGHPIVGDPIYRRGIVKSTKHPLTQMDQGQMLHAQSLRFIHPKTNQTVQFTRELPADMLTIIHNLEHGKEGESNVNKQ